MTSLRIGDLARRFNVPVETIRYYEREGLMPKPERTAGNYRVYSDDLVEHLSFVLNCRKLDMRQDEIKNLISLRSQPAQGCGDVNAMVDLHIDDVTRRIADLKRLLRQLKTLSDSCAVGHEVRDCGILTKLRRPSRSSSLGRSRAKSHVRRVR